ncbi:hypothetical protein B0H16DRAFT_1456763 [Mycena metata]|uniref:Uncharacterized protein n=1 Tax=Mycena metata TaxID=1033252 RepID=A0AAD7NGP1_9AGAR|nr:hypothetical protein B0H16DRAFT_1456763 [Mycena metata]
MQAINTGAKQKGSTILLATQAAANRAASKRERGIPAPARSVQFRGLRLRIASPSTLDPTAARRGATWRKRRGAGAEGSRWERGPGGKWCSIKRREGAVGADAPVEWLWGEWMGDEPYDQGYSKRPSADERAEKRTTSRGVPREVKSTFSTLVAAAAAKCTHPFVPRRTGTTRETQDESKRRVSVRQGPGKLKPKLVRKICQNRPQKATSFRLLLPQKATFGEGSGSKIVYFSAALGAARGATAASVWMVSEKNSATLPSPESSKSSSTSDNRGPRWISEVENPSEKAKSRRRVVKFWSQKAKTRTRKSQNLGLKKPNFRTSLGVSFPGPVRQRGDGRGRRRV